METSLITKVLHVVLCVFAVMEPNGQRRWNREGKPHCGKLGDVKSERCNVPSACSEKVFMDIQLLRGNV